jgi:SWIM zinc finger
MQILIPELTQVKYDPSARAWTTTNGTTAAFPPGDVGKRQAELHALMHDAPDVADEVSAIIANAEAALMFDVEAITSRAIKAGFLIRDGKVWPGVPFDQPGGCLNEIARVRGSQDEAYIVTCDKEDNCYCDCFDFLSERAPILPSGQRACKHILAVLICESLIEDIEQEMETTL